MAGGGSKPGERRGGRQKGTPNKVTKELKDMIMGALDDAGGQAYLAEQAHANPSAFMTLLGKVLPMQMSGKDGDPFILNVARIQLIGPDDAQDATDQNPA